MYKKSKYSFLIYIILFLLGISKVFAHGPFPRSEQPMYQLLVGKNNKQAQLWTLENASQKPIFIKNFPAAFGRRSGDKQKEGDLKTPEGVYFPRQHIDTSKLSQKKYSKTAIELGYPNPIDTMEHKTGHGIWLHGAGDDSRIPKVQVTEGCVAFYNKDMKQLREWIVPHSSIVIVASDLSLLNNKDHIAAVTDRTYSWLKAWESANHKEYMSYYSKKFRLGKRSLKSFSDYKKRIFKSYKKMNIDILKFYVVSHPKYTVVLMNQYFQGDDHFTSVGKKVLYWSYEDGEWKIVREIFDKRFFGYDLSQTKLKTLKIAR